MNKDDFCKMKTIKITEEQLNAIKKLVYEAVDEKNLNKFASGQVNNVVRHLANKAKAGDTSLIQKANDNGINIDSLKGELSHDEYVKNVDSQVQELLNAKNEEINKWVKEYLPILRKCYETKSSDGTMASTMNFQTSKDQVLGRRDANGNLPVTKTSKSYFDNLDGNTRSEVLKVREFLDKEGLTFIYRKANKPKTVIDRYGIVKDDCDWTTPIEDLHMDFSNITDSEAREYYGGTRIVWINKKLKELGYDVESTDKAVSADDAAWKGTDGKEGAYDISVANKREMVARRYIQRKYGMEFNFGQNNNIFSYGNAKISDDTLIINFTAASRCPAWNECLLKDACYARTTEAHYDNTLNRNLRTNLIWEQTEEDPELMELMRRLICACLINYSALATFVNRLKPKDEFTGTLFEASKGPKITADDLVKMKISEIRDKYGDEAIEFMKKKRLGTIVRLNEDGDFIGQWLVDAWDEWAGDLKLVGITVAAYTCRALNYEKIENMILNLSQENLVRGQNAKAIAHYFYAVEPRTYNALGETYVNPAATSEEDRYSLNISPSFNNGRIQPVYRSLVKDGEVLGYYYKCPCGRGKFYYREMSQEEAAKIKDGVAVKVTKFKNDAREDEPQYISFNGRFFVKEKQTDGSQKVDCYRCRICYGRDAEGEIMTDRGTPPEPGKPVYVLVSAHGSNKEDMNIYGGEEGEKKDRRTLAGYTPEQWAGIDINQKEVTAENFFRRPLMEQMGIEESDPVAIKQIVKNTTESVAEHMRQKGGSLDEITKKFNKTLTILENYGK